MLGLAALLGPGCLSYASLVHEFDGLVGFDHDTGLESETYRLRRRTQSYGLWLEPFQAFTPLLGLERGEVEVERPHWRLRDRLVRMVAQSGNKLERLAELAWRCLLVVDQDSSPLDRATAVRCLADLAENVPGRPEIGSRGLPLPGRSRAAKAVAFRDAARAIVRELAELWAREDGERRDAHERARFEARIRELGALEAAGLASERARLRVFREALVYERDARSQRVVAEELLGCLRHALFAGIAQALFDAEALPRKAALDALWRLGREEYLPYAIAALRASNARRLAPGDAKRALVDEDEGVRRQLVLCAGATALPFGLEPVASGPSPIRFLVETSERDPDRGIRLSSRLALCKLAERPAELEGAWIAEWWQRVVTAGGADAR